MSFIAEVERLKLASELSAAPLYSVMTDGKLLDFFTKFIRFTTKVR